MKKLDFDEMNITDLQNIIDTATSVLEEKQKNIIPHLQARLNAIQDEAEQYGLIIVMGNTLKQCDIITEKDFEDLY